MINKISSITNNQNITAQKSKPSFEAMTMYTKLPDGKQLITNFDEKEEINFIKEIIDMINNNEFIFWKKYPEEFAYHPFELKRKDPYNDTFLLKLPKNPDKINAKLSYNIFNRNKKYELAQTTTKTSFFYNSLINCFKNFIGIKSEINQSSTRTKIINFPNKSK